MDYTDFIKYLKQNMPDDKSLAYLAKIEKEHGKEAVLGMVTGGPINNIDPIPEYPSNFFELLYYFPDRVYTSDNDYQYTKTVSTSGFTWNNGTASFVNTDHSWVADPNNLSDYFIYCVHINRINFDLSYKINLFIGMPDFVYGGANYLYLKFSKIPNKELCIPSSKYNSDSELKTITAGCCFSNLSESLYLYAANEVNYPSNNVLMESYNDSYLLLCGKKLFTNAYTVHASLFRLWYGQGDEPHSELKSQFEPFILAGNNYTYFLPQITVINTTQSSTVESFFVNIIHWNLLDNNSKPFLLTPDLKNYLTSIEIE